MAYVDLNPVRAKLARRLAQCQHASISARLLENSPSALADFLRPLASGLRAAAGRRRLLRGGRGGVGPRGSVDRGGGVPGQIPARGPAGAVGGRPRPAASRSAPACLTFGRPRREATKTGSPPDPPRCPARTRRFRSRFPPQQPRARLQRPRVPLPGPRYARTGCAIARRPREHPAANRARNSRHSVRPKTRVSQSFLKTRVSQSFLVPVLSKSFTRDQTEAGFTCFD